MTQRLCIQGTKITPQKTVQTNTDVSLYFLHIDDNVCTAAVCGAGCAKHARNGVAPTLGPVNKKESERKREKRRNKKRQKTQTPKATVWGAGPQPRARPRPAGHGGADSQVPGRARRAPAGRADPGPSPASRPVAPKLIYFLFFILWCLPVEAEAGADAEQGAAGDGHGVRREQVGRVRGGIEHRPVRARRLQQQRHGTFSGNMTWLRGRRFFFFLVLFSCFLSCVGPAIQLALIKRLLCAHAVQAAASFHFFSFHFVRFREKLVT